MSFSNAKPATYAILTEQNMPKTLLSEIKKHTAMLIVILISAIGMPSLLQAESVLHREGEHLKPSGKGFGEHDRTGQTGANAQRFQAQSSNGILYHGGPVMLGVVNLYYIWYGKWDASTNATQGILSSFANGIGSSPYFNINTTYFDAQHRSVGASVVFKGGTFDASSQGFALSDNGVFNVVANAIGANAPDPNGVYLVLGGTDISETSGFCTQYCAWHGDGSLKGVDIKFGFIGNPNVCPNACAAQSPGPNGDLAADGMANLIAHELSESVSDPDLNAWFDRNGYENGDKCAWNFGSVSGPVGAAYNVKLGSRSYLLQQNWVNAKGGYCAQHYP
jgi:hypothetical protein